MCIMANTGVKRTISEKGSGGKGFQENESLAEGEKMTRQKEQRTGLVRRTKQQMGKANQMTALRFHAGGKHQTSPTSLRGRGMPNSVHAITDVKDR